MKKRYHIIGYITNFNIKSFSIVPRLLSLLTQSSISWSIIYFERKMMSFLNEISWQRNEFECSASWGKVCFKIKLSLKSLFNIYHHFILVRPESYWEIYEERYANLIDNLWSWSLRFFIADLCEFKGRFIFYVALLILKFRVLINEKKKMRQIHRIKHFSVNFRRTTDIRHFISIV